MDRNATESDFRTSKIDAGSHFVKKLHKNKNSLLVNIYIHTDSYVGNEGIYIVFALYSLVAKWAILTRRGFVVFTNFYEKVYEFQQCTG